MLVQGIAWIDQSEFRIVRLRTDLLAPQPQVEFQKQTTTIVFCSVRVADSELWLPQAADLEMEASGQHSEEQHRYSNYRLSQAKSAVALSLKAEETKLYADAHPYLDEPLPELKKMVHGLGGLEPAPSQDQLSALLVKVGAKADELLRKVPDLISDEAVTQTQRTEAQETVPGCVGIGCGDLEHTSLRDQEFNYIILTHPAQDRGLSLEEYRTGRNGKPVSETGAPRFQGFVAAWVIFSSLNQVESRFRYLGQQKMDGHTTFVVEFAQIPGSIEQPGKIETGRGSIPMLLQGIAWIDQTDFRIIRLRTDLLAPQPEVGFQKQTANIQFGQVHIAALDSELWLPQTVHVEMEAQGQFLQEQHHYSKYRLYRTKSRIILSTSN